MECAHGSPSSSGTKPIPFVFGRGLVRLWAGGIERRRAFHVQRSTSTSTAAVPCCRSLHPPPIPLPVRARVKIRTRSASVDGRGRRRRTTTTTKGRQHRQSPNTHIWTPAFLIRSGSLFQLSFLPRAIVTRCFLPGSLAIVLSPEGTPTLPRPPRLRPSTRAPSLLLLLLLLLLLPSPLLLSAPAPARGLAYPPRHRFRQGFSAVLLGCCHALVASVALPRPFVSRQNARGVEEEERLGRPYHGDGQRRWVGDDGAARIGASLTVARTSREPPSSNVVEERWSSKTMLKVGGREPAAGAGRASVRHPVRICSPIPVPTPAFSLSTLDAFTCKR
ncbi:hypothetical protein OF83DRAFT_1159289, partial [Amylostereum chailletii]